MSTIDQEKVWQYQAEIKEAKNFLVDISSEEADIFIRDPIKIKALKYTIIVLTEAICNLARHILAKKAHVAIDDRRLLWKLKTASK